MTDTPTDASDIFEITFEGRLMKVTLPTEDQIAVLIHSQQYFGRHIKRLDEVTAQVQALGPKPDPNHPLVKEAERLAGDGIKHAARFQTILKTLLVDEGDWDFLQDGMAERSIRWQAVADLPALILEARNEHRAAEAGVDPANRAARRAKGAGRRAR